MLHAEKRYLCFYLLDCREEQAHSPSNFDPPVVHLVSKTSEKLHNTFDASLMTDNITIEAKRERSRITTENTRQCVGAHYRTKKLLIGQELSFLGEQTLETTTKLLVASVRWLRTVTSFIQMKRTDQEALIYSNWRELFVIIAAQFSFDFAEGE